MLEQMIKTESQTSVQLNNVEEKVCNFNYLNEMVGGKSNLIMEIMDTFLIQVPADLRLINDAIVKKNYSDIKSFAHKMKSSVSIMGISVLTPILQEMMTLGEKKMNIEKINDLNQRLNLICKKAIGEIEKEKVKQSKVLKNNP